MGNASSICAAASEPVQRLVLFVLLGGFQLVGPSLSGAGSDEPRAAAASNLTAAKHWAFQPIADPPLPQVTNTTWSKTGIDRFILERIERAGLTPGPTAPRVALLRRLTFDLTGLPPTPAEAAAFLADGSPDALAKAADRLLSSPRYGERWGRHWLDVARYADSNGMDENLAYASAWRYRDYVIAAFNQDKPYNRFVREQLAGDLLPGAGADDDRHERMVATGFLCIGPKMLAEDDPVKMEMDIVDEQLDTVSRVFMGLTVGCGRCHDHKYDPVPMQDYYAMAGIFKSTHTMDNFKVVARWQERPLGTPIELEALAAGRRRIRDATNQLDALVAEANTNLLRQARGQIAAYLLAAQAARVRDRLLKALPPLNPGTNLPRADQGLVLEADAEASGADLVPEFVRQWTAYLDKTEPEPDSILAAWHSFSQGNLPATALATALLAEPRPATLSELAVRYARRFHEADRAWHELVATTQAPPAKLSDPAEEALRVLLHDPKGPFELPKNAERYYPTSCVAELKRARAALEATERSVVALPEAMAVSEGTAQDLPVHKRGSHLALGDSTRRGFLSSIGAPTGVRPGTNASGRLQLADWMADRDHPLTARVIVNRIWHWHFGEGLVRSPDNFGLLGEAPTHPELLDWLARRFIDSGWSIKAMHRLVLTSAVYQQASLPTAPPGSQVSTALSVDPENKLWARFSRRRLEAEAIRDSILSVSGGLETRLGGPALSMKNREYVTGTGSKLDSSLFETPRRSIYLPVVRSALYDVLQVFDFADPSVLNGRRDQTTVAPQALFMMNSRLVAGASRRLATALLDDAAGTEPSRIGRLYQLAYNRWPTESELNSATRYLDRFQQLAAKGEDPGQARARAWQSLCRVVIAAHEFIYFD